MRKVDSISINNEKKKKYATVISLIVLMICVIGGTYAYFALTASNNSITGKVGGTSIELEVVKQFPAADKTGEMIPQLEGGLSKAISETYNCVDDNGEIICQVYSATITNGNSNVILNGTIRFEGLDGDDEDEISDMPNLKWKMLTDTRTIDEDAEAYFATEEKFVFEKERAFVPMESITYYFVIWVEETGQVQNDTGEFRAVIEFESVGDEGLTSTIKNNGNIQYPISATALVSSLYGDGNTINKVYIGGDTSKPQVRLNNVQRIMLDNNGEYRYYGNETTEDTENGKYLTKNYVSFNGELWRIISSSNVKSSAEDTIGSQRLRIIRADAIGYHAWDYGTDGSDYDNNWETSTLNTTLNEIYYNGTSGTCYIADVVKNSDGFYNTGTATTCDYATGNINGLSEEARNLIDDAVWYLGGNVSSLELHANDFYTFERGDLVSTEGYPNSTVTKLGIIYPSDYAYATDLSVCTKSAGLTWEENDYSSDTSCIGTDWLFNGDWQWLLSPNSGDSYNAFYIDSSGFVDGGIDMDGDFNTSFTLGVRPVAVLKSNVMITGGTGTSGDPYTLALGE